MFTIDGLTWNVKSKIKRIAEMKASAISGMMLNRQYFADVIGTYLKYDISIVIPRNREDEYSRLYEVLTAPVGSHTVVVPYNQGDVTIEGRIESVQDTNLKTRNGNYWMDISFSIIANSPTKEMSLDDIISRGFPPLPDESSVNVGAVYQYTASGWTELSDADESYY